MLYVQAVLAIIIYLLKHFDFTQTIYYYPTIF